MPYPEDQLFELILSVKAKVHPWIRLNRVIRDIPNQYITGGCSVTNMRQVCALCLMMSISRVSKYEMLVPLLFFGDLLLFYVVKANLHQLGYIFLQLTAS